MAAVLASVLALVVVVLGAVAYAAHRAANAAEARRDEIAEGLRTARRELRIALAALATARAEAAVLRRHLTAQAALTPDALDPSWWSTAADIHSLPTTDREMPR
ncbi:hypothetical protein OG271_03810 [Micromonospora rifamycinica]|uniref:hypothetical protein n=1 Tax=Micromonospora rifamycinica TaxID=291594 RepID=UPI002E2AF0C4|nr:hypothetical protein [Micromonospora rifamycinica]